jgi:hypothetical protein
MPYRDLEKHVVHEVRRGLRQLFDIPDGNANTAAAG